MLFHRNELTGESDWQIVVPFRPQRGCDAAPANAFHLEGGRNATQTSSYVPSWAFPGFACHWRSSFSYGRNKLSAKVGKIRAVSGGAIKLASRGPLRLRLLQRRPPISPIAYSKRETQGKKEETIENSAPIVETYIQEEKSEPIDGHGPPRKICIFLGQGDFPRKNP